jgi:DNA-binding beta-propeller fold protein YncE
VKNFKIVFAISLLFLAEAFFSCFTAHGGMKAEEKKQFNLGEKPLDIASSLDGTKIFVLVQGKVLVYSVAEDRITDSLPVDNDLDKVALTGRGNTLILSSSSGKRVEIISFQIIQNIDISGLPFRGPAEAPVTIAVYSDYQ